MQTWINQYGLWNTAEGRQLVYQSKTEHFTSKQAWCLAVNTVESSREHILHISQRGREWREFPSATASHTDSPAAADPGRSAAICTVYGGFQENTDGLGSLTEWAVLLSASYKIIETAKTRKTDLWTLFSDYRRTAHYLDTLKVTMKAKKKAAAWCTKVYISFYLCLQTFSVFLAVQVQGMYRLQ